MIGRNQFGLTLVEVLVAMVLLAIVIVPAVRALHTGIIGTDVHEDVASNQLRLSTRLEQLLVEQYPDLAAAATLAGNSTTPTSYSDPAGPPGRLLVFLAFYDGDNADADNDPFTGGDADLLWIRVEVEDSVHALQTLTARGF